MSLIIVNGRIGLKPEIKKSKSGSSYLSFSLACSEKREGKEDTTWFRCLWMNENASIIPHLDKGSGVCVVGRLQKPKPYQRKDGAWDVSLTVFVTDISFLPSNKPPEQSSQQAQYAASASVFSSPQPGQAEAANVAVQEQLPF